MATSDQLLREYIESLAAEGLERRALEDMEAELIGRVGRLRILRSRNIRDMEAARLLPQGAETVAARQTCHRSTAYRRAKRGRNFVAVLTPQRDTNAI